jgi:hypothetical protein
MVAAEYCALNFNPGVPFIVVVPEVVAAIVICPVPVWIMLSCVPIGKLKVASVGIKRFPAVVELFSIKS